MNTLQLSVDDFLKQYSIFNIDFDQSRDFLYSQRVKQRGFVFIDRMSARKIYVAKHVVMTPKGLVYCCKIDYKGNVITLPSTFVDLTEDDYHLSCTDWSMVLNQSGAISFIGFKPFKTIETWEIEKSYLKQYPLAELFAFRLQPEEIKLNYALI